jgi:tRNA/tmRNA/rRNA uracil-C5-methylase (TrmA/RlmC/RlmD family)
MTEPPELVEVTVGAVAHGGHCVARQPDGPVMFVRHALPGERVRVEVTDRRRGFWRADAVEIVDASPDRVEPPCPYARPRLCGGCDFQHATPAAQRRLKSAVVGEHLGRTDVDVLALPGGPLGWRTRVQYAVDADGRVGFHPHRSHEVVPVDRCLIATPLIQEQDVTRRRWPGVGTVEVIASSDGDVAVLTRQSRTSAGRLHGGPGIARSCRPEGIDRQGTVRSHRPEGMGRHRIVRERAVGRQWHLDAEAFWQVHPAAPDTFAATVVDLLQPESDETAWDLYAGAGLFTAALAPLVHRITAVEADRHALAAARRGLADLDNARVVAGDVRRVLANPRWRSVDLVVLDPPRTGAGREVVEAIAARRPRAVAYVACDPAAFARDVTTFAELGYRLGALRAFDAFPMTHHVECVGLVEPA